ncbi:serine/threonine protein kinase [Myxococcota bacterium]|nr:serine/threonine protein kinase [Myxococcota bacterium]
MARGGRAGEACVGDVLKRARARALQTSTGWVTASFSAADDLATACEALEGASWLGVAVGFGRALELAGQDDRIVAGPLVQDVMGLAARAAPGEVLVWAPERWPASATPAAFHLASAPTPAGDRALSPGEVTGPRLLPPRPAGRPLRPGDVVDERFKLGEVLGTGGFGVVFEALDLRTGQEVVVKLLKDERARDDEAAQRFFDEGRLAARLRGRHVARVHEWGLADDGRLFIVMERLTGRELSLVLRSTGLLDPVRTLRMLADALAGLAEAHAEGLVHRDVKPGNLFVVGEGTPDEHVKLIDFGIALDRTGAVVSMDREGVIVGTPAYVSPEQVLGRSLDGRSDLYALALVAHTCLAGAVPFVGETPYELVWARTVVAPESLAQRAPGPLPDGLAALVDATLALEPDARPASAEAMAQRVRALLSELGAPESWRAAWAGLCGAADPTERFTRRL